MKIVKLHLANLHNEEWYGLFAEFRGLVPVYGGAEGLGIAPLYTLLLPLHDKADQLLETMRKSAYTKELENAGKACDEIIRGLYETVKASRRLPDQADTEAAERLYILLTRYHKTALNSSYAEKASAIYNLLQDLGTPYAADISLLGFGKWVTNLSAAGQQFVDYRDARDKEKAEKPTEHLRKIRSQVTPLYKSITDILYATLLADGLGGDVDISPEDLKTGAYESSVPSELRGNVVYNFVVAWNIVLKRYQTTLAIRAGRKPDAKPGPEPGDEPGDEEGLLPEDEFPISV
jgi:hypothetical protein